MAERPSVGQATIKSQRSPLGAVGVRHEARFPVLIQRDNFGIVRNPAQSNPRLRETEMLADSTGMREQLVRRSIPDGLWREADSTSKIHFQRHTRARQEMPGGLSVKAIDGTTHVFESRPRNAGRKEDQK